MHVCMYVYIYINLCVYLFSCFIYLCIMNVCMYVCMHACMHACMHVCTYIYIYIYMCVYISKFGDCKRQVSPANRDPVQTGNCQGDARARSQGISKIPESAIESVAVVNGCPVSVRGAAASVSARSNVAVRGLCGDFCQNSLEPRCARSLRPIAFSTLVSYRAGRCLRTWVSSNVAVRGVC